MKKLILIFSLLGLTACSSHQDENYYLSHPEIMEQALKDCPSKSPNNLSCSQLKELAYAFNQMADELRSNPQTFGKKILSLQEKLAEAKLKGKESANIQRMEKDISRRLIMVKLFESPEG